MQSDFNLSDKGNWLYDSIYESYIKLLTEMQKQNHKVTLFVIEYSELGPCFYTYTGIPVVNKNYEVVLNKNCEVVQIQIKSTKEIPVIGKEIKIIFDQTFYGDGDLWVIVGVSSEHHNNSDFDVIEIKQYS